MLRIYVIFMLKTHTSITKLYQGTVELTCEPWLSKKHVSRVKCFYFW